MARQASPGHEDDRDYVRWCFAEPHTATAFAAEFGGTVIRDQ
jgi:hypothetical protein